MQWSFRIRSRLASVAASGQVESIDPQNRVVTIFSEACVISVLPPLPDKHTQLVYGASQRTGSEAIHWPWPSDGSSADYTSTPYHHNTTMDSASSKDHDFGWQQALSLSSMKGTKACANAAIFHNRCSDPQSLSVPV